MSCSFVGGYLGSIFDIIFGILFGFILGIILAALSGVIFGTFFGYPKGGFINQGRGLDEHHSFYYKKVDTLTPNILHFIPRKLIRLTE